MTPALRAALCVGRYVANALQRTRRTVACLIFYFISSVDGVILTVLTEKRKTLRE